MSEVNIDIGQDTYYTRDILFLKLNGYMIISEDLTYINTYTHTKKCTNNKIQKIKCTISTKKSQINTFSINTHPHSD